ncbi:TetR/AcrR family transcriptional regulator [Kitasatospora sp. NBC_01287]|uniref:TetR/AcrR family transcriptional regulator n=1 Tax=Kitasatospora sp. NBC_01287 TaxID=2903573 RepID=UPI00224D88EB|nr:TetR/AcrR family transcriptional regulator [Kitasatospora sp. NBC_01287]MCX4744799.1 TetR/AcrR family transcriptional regulator [Kitasatospora sp. NBC_01287]
MDSQVPTTPRERYRTQVRAEIKQHAWEQIASAGASALSLNAIAKQLGMSGPALYRYFAGRDELLTELVQDAYRSLADAVRAAAEAPGAEPGLLARALYRWALDDPQRYLLIYGTPIPGYHAPDGTTAVAAEIMDLLISAFAALPPAAPVPFDDYLATHRDWAGGHPAPAAVLRRALTFWTRLHGLISLQVAGHFAGMGFDPERFFEAEVDQLLAP